MRVVIGPVSAHSARIWLAYARDVVAELGKLAPDECFATSEVRRIFAGYLTDWIRAARGDEFVWEREIEPEQVEYHVHAFHQVAMMLARREERTGEPQAPAGGEDFYAAVLTGTLNALEAEGQASAAFARHLGEFWPGQQRVDR